MDVYRGHRALPRRLHQPAIAIGNFDGVHLGHAALVTRARAAAAGGEVVVLTFDPHPSRVLAPHATPPLLTSADRKLELLEAAGADVVVIEPFTAELAAMPAPRFVDQVMVAALGARHVVVGPDFRYGQGRAGTVTTLVEAGRANRFAVDVVDPVRVAGEVVSSTAVRAGLQAGDVTHAAALLGRVWDTDGVVVRGAGRGKGLGVPTANVAPELPLLVPSGIYAVELRRLGVDAVPLPSVASLGTNPTFGSGTPMTLEVHVLDFDADLYDVRVRVGFVARLRDEARYDTVEALLVQIDDDIARARAVLAGR